MYKLQLIHKSYSITVHTKKGISNKNLVFLHGGSIDNSMLSWKEVIELMGDIYNIYAIDMLGYGESDKPDIQYSIPIYVELIYDIFKQLNINKTYLVGLSMGGGISIAFSLKFPKMVTKLVLVGSYGLYNKMPFHSLCRWFVNSKFNSKSYVWMAKSKRLVRWSIMSSLIGDKNMITDELVNNLYNLIQETRCNMPWESFQRYELGKKKLTTDLASHLSKLEMPVLIVNGEKDSGVPSRYAVKANKVIKNSQLHIMKGCKHWAQKERPEEFTNILKIFLLDSSI